MRTAYELLGELTDGQVSADQLLSARERLTRNSDDAHARYTCGWLAIEAAKVDADDSDNNSYFDLALNDWESVVKFPETNYAHLAEVLPYMAKTCHALAEPIRSPFSDYGSEQRTVIAKRLGRISRSDDRKLQKTQSKRLLGFATELAALQLSWRDTSEYGVAVIPANQAQEVGSGRSNADLIAFGNSQIMPHNPIKIQVKTSKNGAYGNYNNRAVLLIGSDDNFRVPNKMASPSEKTLILTEACAKEANGNLEDEQLQASVDYSTRNIIRKIRKHSRKTWNYQQKKSRK